MGLVLVTTSPPTCPSRCGRPSLLPGRAWSVRPVVGRAVSPSEHELRASQGCQFFVDRLCNYMDRPATFADRNSYRKDEAAPGAGHLKTIPAGA